MTRVLIWATHLQTDILALALHLDRCRDIALMVVTPDRDIYLHEPCALARRFAAPLLDRNHPATAGLARDFAADVVVADNHVPPKGMAPRLFYMWHGMGWKARSALDLKVFYHQVRQLTGHDPRDPNPCFRAQCYGPTDRAWRVRNWGLPASACVPIGMCFADLLLDPPYAREDLAGHYRIDVARRKTVLLAITWHYGGIFAQKPGLGRMLRSLIGRSAAQCEDIVFLDRIIARVGSSGANLLICLHDRHRYDPAFLTMVEQRARAHDFIEIRFKNEHPDNMADLLVADVMISNLSSFLAYHYLLRRPALHILPADPDSARIERQMMLFSRIRLRRGLARGAAWMLDPHDTGGPIVRTPDEAMRALDAALDDPQSGREPTGRWLEKHIPMLDGKACERFRQAIVEFCAAG